MSLFIIVRGLNLAFHVWDGNNVMFKDEYESLTQVVFISNYRSKPIIPASQLHIHRAVQTLGCPMFARNVPSSSMRLIKSQSCKKTLPEAQRTQGIESVT